MRLVRALCIAILLAAVAPAHGLGQEQKGKREEKPPVEVIHVRKTDSPRDTGGQSEQNKGEQEGGSRGSEGRSRGDSKPRKP